MASDKKSVRESVIAGSWYPGKKEDLAKLIDSFLGNADNAGLGDVKALIAPHAGYAYSGQVAAHAYKQIAGKEYKKVMILAPSHHVGFRGASIPDYTYFETPLGEIKVSSAAGSLKKESKLIQSIDLIEEKEHSLEIQLPFLQKVLGSGFELIPMVVGDLSEKDRTDLAELLTKHLDDETLLVVSTDLSHYYPYDTAALMDTECTDAITDLDIEAAEGCEMCGMNPVLVLLEIAKKLNWNAHLLKYANSGDATGDTSGVVGYAAIAFYSGKKEGNKGNKKGAAGDLNNAEKKYLLGLARETIENYVKSGEVTEPHTDDRKLKETRGAFVTLEKKGQLRGCIGHIVPVQPLFLDVRDNAISAATEDPRFRQVVEEELDKIEIEISVLTFPEEIKTKSAKETLEAIKPGIDGIILEYKGRGATYLPQVWEQLPGKEEFLDSLCMKAGLSPGDWKQKDAKISRYQVQAFKESDLP
ncbi:MAG: AmmeMemoRadiSam system protein B [Candidatus Altiarchaeia archaeon]